MSKLTTPHESCSEHDHVHPSELTWVYQLEPSQIDGMFWCWDGKHYIRATKTMLPAALYVLEQIGDLVRA